MVRVIFDGVERELTTPARLMDVCDELRAPVAFSCRDGNCGTCAITITQGAELLSQPSAHELRTLMETKLPRGCRLACRARIVGAGVLRLVSAASAREPRG